MAEWKKLAIPAGSYRPAPPAPAPRIGAVVTDVDNRDPEDMVGYLEARVEALRRRNYELEDENAALKAALLERRWTEHHEAELESIR